MKKNILKITLAFLSIVLISSCSKKDDKISSPQNLVSLDTKSISLHYDESHQFYFVNKSVIASDYNWVSTDETIGTVDRSGKFTAQKIGTTTIKATKGSEVFESQVTVVPYSTICKEPYWNFSDNISATKGKETRTILSQTSTSLVYTGENAKIRNIMYMYDSTSGKMSSAAILFAYGDAVIQEAAKFFKERYYYLGEDTDADSGNTFYYFGDEKNIVIGITQDAKLGLITIYIPNTGGNGSVNSTMAKTLLDVIKNAKKVQ